MCALARPIRAIKAQIPTLNGRGGIVQMKRGSKIFDQLRASATDGKRVETGDQKKQMGKRAFGTCCMTSLVFMFPTGTPTSLIR